MLFDVVGMQLDQSGQQVISAPVLGFVHGGRAGRDFCNSAVGYPYHARELFVARNNARVFDQHVCKVSVAVAACPAGALRWMRRGGTQSSPSSLCKITTQLAPRPPPSPR